MSTLYGWQLGVCQRLHSDTEGVVADLEPVPPGVFAEGRPVPIAAGPRVVREEFETEDGARYPGRLWDRELGGACSVVTLDERFERAACVMTGGSGFQFGDCDLPVAIDPASCPATPGELVVIGSLDACRMSRTRALFEIGEPLSEADRRAAMCGASVEAGPLRGLSPVPWSRAAPLALRRQGGGRLHPLIIESADGNSIEGREFWDDQLDAACRSQEVAGELRCVPDAYTVHFVGVRPRFFADPGCEVPAARLGPPPCARVYISVTDDCFTGPARAIFEVGERLDQWYEQDGDRCVPVESAAGGTVFRLEDPGFARLRRVERQPGAGTRGRG